MTTLHKENQKIKYDYNSRKKLLTRKLIEEGVVNIPGSHTGKYQITREEKFKGTEAIKALHKHLKDQVNSKERARASLKQAVERSDELNEKDRALMEKLDKLGVDHRYKQLEGMKEQIEVYDDMHKSLQRQKRKLEAAVKGHIKL